MMENSYVKYTRTYILQYAKNKSIVLGQLGKHNLLISVSVVWISVFRESRRNDGFFRDKSSQSFNPEYNLSYTFF